MGNAEFSEFTTFKIKVYKNDARGMISTRIVFCLTSDLIDGCKGRNCTTAYWSTSGEAAHSQRVEVK